MTKQKRRRTIVPSLIYDKNTCYLERISWNIDQPSLLDGI